MSEDIIVVHNNEEGRKKLIELLSRPGEKISKNVLERIDKIDFWVKIPIDDVDFCGIHIFQFREHNYFEFESIRKPTGYKNHTKKYLIMVKFKVLENAPM